MRAITKLYLAKYKARTKHWRSANSVLKKNTKELGVTLYVTKRVFSFFFLENSIFYQNNLTKLPKTLSFKMDVSLHCTLFLVSMSNVYLHVASSICQSHNLFDIFYDRNCFQILQWKKGNQSETNSRFLKRYTQIFLTWTTIAFHFLTSQFPRIPLLSLEIMDTRH